MNGLPGGICVSWGEAGQVVIQGEVGCLSHRRQLNVDDFDRNWMNGYFSPPARNTGSSRCVLSKHPGRRGRPAVFETQDRTGRAGEDSAGTIDPVSSAVVGCRLLMAGVEIHANAVGLLQGNTDLQAYHRERWS
ncbi:MAG: hypothetical protein IPK52_15990 [Chloroflexi bacterium]|nr:hypothetical protein [Chloroflexota bacterium]